MIIKGPDGRSADVDEENRLSTRAITETLDRHINDHGGAFSIYFKVTPTAIGDYFFYMKNNELFDVSITAVRISSTVPTSLYYEHVAGTPIFVVGTQADITNKNLGSATELNIEAIYDADITGIISRGILLFDKLSTANELSNTETESNVLVPQGQSVAMRIEDAVGEIEAIISIVTTS